MTALHPALVFLGGLAVVVLGAELLLKSATRIAHMPRSLHHCMSAVMDNLRLVGAEPQGETMRHAGRMRADLRFGHIEEILATGLHAFLTQFLDRVNTLGGHISRDFLVAAD